MESPTNLAPLLCVEPESTKLEIKKTRGSWSPFWLLTKSAMSTSVLGLPYLSYHAGSAFVTFFLLGSITLVNFYASYKYIDIANLLNYNGGSTRHIAITVLGKTGYILNEISLFAQCFLSVTSFIQACSMGLSELICGILHIEMGCFNYEFYFIIPFITILLQTLLLKRSYKYTIFGFCSGFLLLGMLFCEIIFSFLQMHQTGVSDYPAGFSFTGSLYLYSSAMFAVETNMLVLTFRYDSENPSDFKKGMDIAYTIVFIMYMLVSIILPYGIGSQLHELSFLSFKSYPFLGIIGYTYLLVNLFYVPVFLYPYYYSNEQTVEFKNLEKFGFQVECKKEKKDSISTFFCFICICNKLNRQKLHQCYFNFIWFLVSFRINYISTITVSFYNSENEKTIWRLFLV